MPQVPAILPPVELKAILPPYGIMPPDRRDCLMARKIYRHEDAKPEPSEPEQLDKKA
jgi:hypothetical protein